MVKRLLIVHFDTHDRTRESLACSNVFDFERDSRDRIDESLDPCHCPCDVFDFVKMSN